MYVMMKEDSSLIWYVTCSFCYILTTKKVDIRALLNSGKSSGFLVKSEIFTNVECTFFNFFIHLQVEVLSRPETQTGKLKKFLSVLSKSHLQAIITLALREEQVMIKVS